MESNSGIYLGGGEGQARKSVPGLRFWRFLIFVIFHISE